MYENIYDLTPKLNKTISPTGFNFEKENRFEILLFLKYQKRCWICL